MTRIHEAPHKKWQPPLWKRDSVYRTKDWFVTPDAKIPSLEIWENGNNMDIDICIPGVTKDQVEVMGHKKYMKRSIAVTPREEFIHILLPK